MSGTVSYQLQYRPNGTILWANWGIPTSNTSALVTGLKSNSAYDFQVIASDDFGSVISPLATITTPPQTPVAQSVVITGSAAGSLRVSSILQIILLSAIHPIGSVSVSANVNSANITSNSSRITGAVSTAVNATAERWSAELTPGVGSVTVATTLQALTNATISGTAVVTTAQVGQAFGAIAIGAAAGVTVSGSIRVAGKSAVAGAAATTARATGVVPGSPVLVGTGTVAALANLLTTQQWSSSHKFTNGPNGATITLSNNNLTATETGAADNSSVYATVTATTGKYYWETVITCADASNITIGAGNINAGVFTNQWVGSDSNALGWLGSDGRVLINGGTAEQVLTTWATYVSGATVGIALDLTNGLMWGRVNTGLWNNSSSANPATGTGGLAIPSTVLAAAVSPGCTLAAVNDNCVGKFASSSWTFAAPSGFASWTTLASSGSVQGSVQVTLGAHVALEINTEPAGAYANAIDHYNGFNSGMGRTATVIATILGGNDVFSFKPGSAPNTWGNGDAASWSSMGFPVDGTAMPMLHWTFSDGSTDTAFSIYSPANISTANFAGTGHTVAFYITNQLTAWKNIGIKKMYIRINWEWNINGPGTQDYVTPTTTAAWLDAWRGWSNVAHDWGNANGVSVNMIWSPSVFNSSDDQGQAIRAYFPAPDVNAHFGGDGVTKRYIDIIGPDFYGQFDPTFVPTGYSKLTNRVWCMRAMTDLCQDFGLNLGIPETNDQLTVNQNAWQNWTPNVFVPYLNGLKNLSSPVKIEFICMFDINAGNAHEFSAVADNQPGNLAIFGQAFGGLGPDATYGTCAKVTTLP